MLTELKGSEKQIRWAKSIRTERINRWKSSDPIVFQRVEPNLNSETSAAWWIDFREKELAAVLTFLQGGTTGKGVTKPKVTKAPLFVPSPEKKSYVSTGDDGGITRRVGELRDTITGELVIDPDCPF